MLAGGALGAAIVFSITIAAPKIGTTAVVALLIAGQLVAATVIDRYGWFGFDRVALDWPRVLGIALLAAGAALTLRRPCERRPDGSQRVSRALDGARADVHDAIQSTETGPGKAPIASPRRSSSVTAERPSSP